MTKEHILIVGAGEFGASTALSLLQSGKYTVTILDRATELPAMDAASTDINKVVRFDYAEKEYADLCAEAIKRWKKDFPGVYHEWVSWPSFSRWVLHAAFGEADPSCHDARGHTRVTQCPLVEPS